jgi:putative transcriptional regulator
MSVVTTVKPVGIVRWKLRECMARRKVTNVGLGLAVKAHPTSIARLKAQDTLPEIGNDRIEQIRMAIEKLSGKVYGPCSAHELLEVLDD